MRRRPLARACQSDPSTSRDAACAFTAAAIRSNRSASAKTRRQSAADTASTSKPSAQEDNAPTMSSTERMFECYQRDGTFSDMSTACQRLGPADALPVHIRSDT